VPRSCQPAPQQGCTTAPTPVTTLHVFPPPPPQEEKAKRAARAAKFGMPVAEPLAYAPDPEELKKKRRGAKFGGGYHPEGALMEMGGQPREGGLGHGQGGGLGGQAGGRVLLDAVGGFGVVEQGVSRAASGLWLVHGRNGSSYGPSGCGRARGPGPAQGMTHPTRARLHATLPHSAVFNVLFSPTHAAPARFLAPHHSSALLTSTPLPTPLPQRPVRGARGRAGRRAAAARCGLPLRRGRDEHR
jgi:hypothetical protein